MLRRFPLVSTLYSLRYLTGSPSLLELNFEVLEETGEKFRAGEQALASSTPITSHVKDSLNGGQRGQSRDLLWGVDRWQGQEWLVGACSPTPGFGGPVSVEAEGPWKPQPRALRSGCSHLSDGLPEWSGERAEEGKVPGGETV